MKTWETGRLWGHENMSPREPAQVGLEREQGSLKGDAKERLGVWHSLEQKQPSKTGGCEDLRRDPSQPTPHESSDLG